MTPPDQTPPHVTPPLPPPPAAGGPLPPPPGRWAGDGQHPGWPPGYGPVPPGYGLPPSDPYPATWKAIHALWVGLIAFGVALVLGVIVELIYGFPASGNASDIPAPAFAVANIVQELALFVTVVLWVKYVAHAPVAALGKPRRPLADLGIGIGAGLALVLVAGVALIVVQVITSLVTGNKPTTPDQIPTSVTGWPLIVSGFTVVLLAPLGEETFFRGFLYKGLRRRYSLWPAALISALFFGLVHIYPLLIVPLAVVGLTLALLYEWRQSLLVTMAAHATFNLVGFLTIFLSRR